MLRFRHRHQCYVGYSIWLITYDGALSVVMVILSFYVRWWKVQLIMSLINIETFLVFKSLNNVHIRQCLGKCWFGCEILETKPTSTSLYLCFNYRNDFVLRIFTTPQKDSVRSNLIIFNQNFRQAFKCISQQGNFVFSPQLALLTFSNWKEHGSPSYMCYTVQVENFLRNLNSAKWQICY